MKIFWCTVQMTLGAAYDHPTSYSTQMDKNGMSIPRISMNMSGSMKQGYFINASFEQQARDAMQRVFGYSASIEVYEVGEAVM